MWHERVLFKLSQNRISGNLLKLLTDFLKHRLTLNREIYFRIKVNAGVAQCSILGPLLLLICRNDLPYSLSSNVKLIDDDTSLFFVVQDIHSSTRDLNKDLKTINEWAF